MNTKIIKTDEEIEIKSNWPDEVRLKMIEKSEFYQEPQIYQYGYYDGYQKGIALSGAVEGNGWIDVKTDLPDYDEPVLWLFEDGNMQVESLDKDGNPWLWGEEREGFKFPPATHWRLLPKSPIK